MLGQNLLWCCDGQIRKTISKVEKNHNRDRMAIDGMQVVSSCQLMTWRFEGKTWFTYIWYLRKPRKVRKSWNPISPNFTTHTAIPFPPSIWCVSCYPLPSHLSLSALETRDILPDSIFTTFFLSIYASVEENWIRGGKNSISSIAPKKWQPNFPAS